MLDDEDATRRASSVFVGRSVTDYRFLLVDSFCGKYKEVVLEQRGFLLQSDEVLAWIRAWTHPFMLSLMDHIDQLHIHAFHLCQGLQHADDALPRALRVMPVWAIAMVSHMSVEQRRGASIRLRPFEIVDEQISTAILMERSMRQEQRSRDAYNIAGVAREIETRLQKASPQLDIQLRTGAVPPISHRIVLLRTH